MLLGVPGPVSAPDDLEAVIRLACLTEDRTDAEQRAMLRVARKLDAERNANVTGNHRMWGVYAGSTSAQLQRPMSRLEQLVEETRVLVDEQRAVKLKPKIPAGRHDPSRCASVGGCGHPADHPIHSGG